MNWNQLLCSERIRCVATKKQSQDVRSEFGKDYHRIVGSASFRRLQDKTQVFPLDKSDFVRTRLTHSMEVSSFAKSLAQYVGAKLIREQLDDSFHVEHQMDICDILECAGLLHDIGNPPFGHFGETLIRDWFREHLSKISMNGKTLEALLAPQMKEDFLHFEGNTQALRLVTKLHFLVDEHGMNLNKALLATIIKYPVSSIGINKKSGNVKDKKMGYYYADEPVFQNIIEAVGTNGNRHPLTYLLEAADDIAYKTADIEDAVKKGFVTYPHLLEQLDVKLGKDTYGLKEKLVQWYERALVKECEEPQVYAVQNWLVWIQGKALYQAGDSFLEHYSDIMSGIYTKDLFANTEIEPIMDLLGEIAYKEVFRSKAILKMELSAASIVNYLLNHFVDAVIYYDTEIQLTQVQERYIQLISQNYIRIYHAYSKDKSDIEKLYLRLLLVTDFICGMTDSYAKTLYEELTGKC